MVNNKGMSKPKIKKRDAYLIAAIINLCWYTIAALILTAFGKLIPDSLTIAWFSAWTAELALVAGIKITERSKSNGGQIDY